VKSLGRVGVLLGGKSGEREISLMSGNGVLEALISKGVDAQAFDPGLRCPSELAAEKFDRIFISLHGRYGEDGTIQGLLELLGLPYTGSGVLASALAIDKIVTKQIWISNGLSTPKYEELTATSNWDAVVKHLGLPLIVKPANEGSSLGLTKVKSVLEPLRRQFPELKIVFEHITTKQAAHYVRDAVTSGKNTIAATITPQHLLMNRNAIFAGGIRPHNYCLPVLKREEHRVALLEAATSGNPRFFLGTDSAPHAKGAKEAACGCAGCYSAYNALGLYAEAFESVGKLDKLEGFASFYGPDFYSLPRNTKTITLVKQAQDIPVELPLGDATIVPLRAGETIAWSLI
jgi:hypothetical protein